MEETSKSNGHDVDGNNDCATDRKSRTLVIIGDGSV